MSNNKQSMKNTNNKEQVADSNGALNQIKKVSNKFLQNAESTHLYNDKLFIVHFYPNLNKGTWQCCDSRHLIRATAITKQEAIDLCHKHWHEYAIKEKGGNNEETKNT